MSDLALAEVHKTFGARGGDGVTAVDGLSLTVDSGRLVALLGPSGCGKSTTLRMIAGLEEVSLGDIRLGGRSLVGLSPQQRNIGVAFENYALYPPLTVAQNIAFGLRARGNRQWRHRVDEITERLGLVDILDARPGALSSGQKQRVALARAIARRPEVLLLDEPLSHLDATQRDTTRRELRRLQRELGYTTILVTHDQEEALSLADQVVVMRDGLAQQIGTPGEIYDDPASLFVAEFVGEPAINTLDGDLIERAGGPAVRLGAGAELPVRLGAPPAPPAAVTVGLRPESIRLAPADRSQASDDTTLTASVLVVEDFLEFALVTLELPGVGRRLVAQVPADTAPAAGGTVEVRTDPDRGYVFDRETGERIR